MAMYAMQFSGRDIGFRVLDTSEFTKEGKGVEGKGVEGKERKRGEGKRRKEKGREGKNMWLFCESTTKPAKSSKEGKSSK